MQVISEASNLSLRALFRHTHSARLLPLILPFAVSKKTSPGVRARCVEYVLIVLELWAWQDIEKHSDRIEVRFIIILFIKIVSNAVIIFVYCRRSSCSVSRMRSRMCVQAHAGVSPSCAKATRRAASEFCEASTPKRKRRYSKKASAGPRAQRARARR